MSKILNENGYRSICKENWQVAKDKNADYGTDNLTKFGLRGIVMRMYDKINRLATLTDPTNTTSRPNYESVKDSLLDVMNYAVFGALIQENRLLVDKFPKKATLIPNEFSHIIDTEESAKIVDKPEGDRSPF